MDILTAVYLVLSHTMRKTGRIKTYDFDFEIVFLFRKQSVIFLSAFYSSVMLQNIYFAFVFLVLFSGTACTRGIASFVYSDGYLLGLTDPATG